MPMPRQEQQPHASTAPRTRRTSAASAESPPSEGLTTSTRSNGGMGSGSRHHTDVTLQRPTALGHRPDRTPNFKMIARPGRALTGLRAGLRLAEPRHAVRRLTDLLKPTPVMDLFERAAARAGTSDEETVEGTLDARRVRRPRGRIHRRAPQGRRRPSVSSPWSGRLLGVPVGARLRVRGRRETDPRYGPQLRVTGYTEVAPADRRGIAALPRARGSSRASGPSSPAASSTPSGCARSRCWTPSPERIAEVPGHRPGAGAVGQGGLDRAARDRAGDGVPAGLRRLAGLRSAHLQALRRGSHRARAREPLPARLRRLGHRLPVGRPAGDRAGHRPGRRRARWRRACATCSTRRPAAGTATSPRSRAGRGGGPAAGGRPRAGRAGDRSARPRRRRGARSRWPTRTRPCSRPRCTGPSGRWRRGFIRLAEARPLGRRWPPTWWRRRSRAYERRGRPARSPGSRPRRSGRCCATRWWSSPAGPGSARPPSCAASSASSRAAGLAVALAAPTGRAAKRLSETTGRPAATLHRLLEWRPADVELRRATSSARSRPTCWWSTRPRCWTCGWPPTWSTRCRPGPGWCWWATSTSSPRWGRARCWPT